jgi:two-component system KDP operon response regulator KdpE
MKILIADDDPLILKVLRITLTAKGHQVLTAVDGQQALESAAEQDPDILMLDLGMPWLDGTEVIRAVRNWSGAPILVISGRTTETDRAAALAAGADDFLIKPFSIDDVLVRIDALTAA